MNSPSQEFVFYLHTLITTRSVVKDYLGHEHDSPPCQTISIS